MTADAAKALELAARAQAVCDAQHGSGDRCCLMREVADCLRAYAAHSSGESPEKLDGLLDHCKDFGAKLYYIGDGLWSAELWGADRMYEATGPDAMTALSNCYSALQGSNARA